MSKSFFNLLLRWAVLALGVTIATKVIPGIRYDDVGTLIVVVLLLSFCNAVLRPVLMLFAISFIIVTAGLGVLIINALLFLLVGYLVTGFHVDGFWPALGGSLVVSVTTLFMSFALKRPPARPAQSRPAERKDKDVIDI